MNEEWKTIQGCPNYMVSNLGRIKNKEFTYQGSIGRGHAGETKARVKKEHIKKITQNEKCPYAMVTLITAEGKRITPYVHILVARAFVDNPNNYKYTKHINGDLSDNRAENLRWISSSNTKENKK